jgi:hypothetical protein
VSKWSSTAPDNSYVNKNDEAGTIQIVGANNGYYVSGAALTYIQNDECYTSVTITYSWSSADGAGYDYGVYLYSDYVNHKISPTDIYTNVASTITIGTDNGYVKIGVYTVDSCCGAGTLFITDIAATPCPTPTISPTLAPTIYNRLQWSYNTIAGGSISDYGDTITIVGNSDGGGFAAFTYIQNSICFQSITMSYSWNTIDTPTYDYGAYLQLPDTSNRNVIGSTYYVASDAGSITLYPASGYVRIGVYKVDSLYGSGTLIITGLSGIPCSPSVQPTENPTATPTFIPTSTPSSEPTLTPSLEPTSTPTLEPTVTPTLIPTSTPTIKSYYHDDYLLYDPHHPERILVVKHLTGKI